MGTGGAPYTNPVRPRITIKTVDGQDTLYTYNAFEEDNDISVTGCSMENAVGETGNFSALINDHNNEIGKDNLHDVKVFMELGKTDSTFQHFIIGYADLFAVDRPGTNAQFYQLSGLGSKEWLYNLYISRREKYRRDEADAKIYNIITNAFTKRLWRPLKKQDESIQDVTGMDPSGISSKVNMPLTIVDYQFVYFGDLADQLADASGAVSFVDFSTGSEIYTFKFKPDLMTRIKIKSGDLADRINDNPDRISYIQSGFIINDNSSKDVSFANRLYSSTIQDSIEVFPLDAVNYAAGSTNTTFKALGQQIILDSDTRRITELELHLRKRGEPTSPQSRINGGVFMDNGSNKPNMTHTLDIFHVDLGSIEEQGTKIAVPVDIGEDRLFAAQSKIWVVIFQRSNEEDEEGNPDGNGNPNHGEDHTVLWAHNNKFNILQQVNGNTLFSGQAPEGDFDSKSKLSWTTTDKGPTYYVKVFSDIRRLFARTSGQSKLRSRLKELFVASDFLDNPTDVMRFLSLSLSQTSKARRGIGNFTCTIPNNFLFRPYQQVSFNDGLSDTSEILQVDRAGYNCTASGRDDVPLGTLRANLTLSGSYNTLVGACNCI